MPENRQGKWNGGVSNSSNLSAQHIQEAIRRLKIRSNDKQDGDAMAQSIVYPNRPGEPDCVYYMKTGTCGYGINCRFNHPSTGQIGQYAGEHPERAGAPDCEYFMKTGTCKFGSTCKYNHPRDRHGAGPIVLNIYGLPMRQEEKSCPYYMRTGSCKFGVACKFDHPQPGSPGPVVPVPVPVPVPYSSTGLSIVPSSAGLPYEGAPQHWSLPRATTYVTGPRPQGPQAYLPVVIPSSQGIVPPHYWNPYSGSMSPASSNSNGQLHPFPPSLPERPDQPECRYFMNNGTCKFGTDCKYNHPREKFAQLAASSMGPLGLPLRPGQAVCSYYSLYGICKYGPTCRYDHPLMGYSYNYNLSIPTLSVPNPALLTYQRNSPTIQSSEISPSKSSKFQDWSHKPETADDNISGPNASTPRHSPSNSVPDPSETAHDQSD